METHVVCPKCKEGNILKYDFGFEMHFECEMLDCDFEKTVELHEIVYNNEYSDLL